MKGNLIVGIMAVATLLGSGCATQPEEQLPPVVTPTGRPEVVIVGATLAQVASELATACAVSLHGSVSKADPGEVVCGDLPQAGQAEGLWMLLNESEEGGHATDEAIFHLLDTGQGVRVMANRRVTAYNAYGRRARFDGLAEVRSETSATA